MKIDKHNKKVDDEYSKFMKKEQRGFNAGKRNSKPVICEGNIW